MKKIETENLSAIWNDAGLSIYEKNGDLIFFILKEQVKEIKEIFDNLPAILNKHI